MKVMRSMILYVNPDPVVALLLGQCANKNARIREVRDSLGDPGGVTVLNSVALTPPGSNPTAFGPSCCRR